MRGVLASLVAIVGGAFQIVSAQATVITYMAPGVLVDPRASLVDSFNSFAATKYGLTTKAGTFRNADGIFSGNGLVMRNGPNGDLSALGMYAEPAHDHSNYLAIMANDTESIKYGSKRNWFGMYWGSIDAYNYISFFDDRKKVASYSGENIKIVPDMPYGDQQSDSTNRYVEFHSLPKYDTVVLGSGGNSLEVDNITSGIPEVSTWAMMLLGFSTLGMIGFSRGREGVSSFRPS